MKLTKKEETIRKQWPAVQAKLFAIEEEKRRAKNAPLQGKYFKFRNTFGGDSEGWWLYLHVVKAVAWLECVTFETRTDGEIQIRSKNTYSSLKGYTQITATEYAKAWGEMLSAILSIHGE